MNELKVFAYEGRAIRTVEKDGEPWWVLKDVCDTLELSNSRMVADRLDDDEVSKFDLRSQVGEVHVINESGLYNVILRSDKPEAKRFKRWVTQEVLPSIRKTGGYAAGNETAFIINTVTATIMGQLPAIIAETVKALNLVSSDVKTVPAEKPKKRRLNYHGKIDALPRDLRNEVITMIYSKNYTLLEVANRLTEAGHAINQSSVRRFVNREARDIGELAEVMIESD